MNENNSAETSESTAGSEDHLKVIKVAVRDRNGRTRKVVGIAPPRFTGDVRLNRYTDRNGVVGSREQCLAVFHEPK